MRTKTPARKAKSLAKRPPSFDAKCWKLRRSGMTLAEVAGEMRAPVSTTAVACRRGELAATRSSRRKAAALPVAAPATDSEPVDVLSWLDEQLHLARTEQLSAQKDKEGLRSGRAGKAIHALLALRAKYTPQAPVDPNERPDMVALAKACRERLQAYSARAAAIRATWPRCGQCGQHVEPVEVPAPVEPLGDCLGAPTLSTSRRRG